MALLRLAPDHRGEALAAARDLRDEPGAAIRYAPLGKRRRSGDSGCHLAAAAWPRSPWSDDPAVLGRHPGLGPDAGRAAIYDLDAISLERPYDDPLLKISLVPELPEGAADRADLPTVSFHANSQIFANQWPSPATIWPSALESYFADGLKRLVRATDNVTDEPRCREFFIPLLNPDVPLRPMARLLIGVGLTAKVPELAGLATDALIAAIDDGRIDAARLGESLRTVWRWEVRASNRDTSRARTKAESSVGFAKANRWAKTLGDVARASALHAHVVACALEQVLADGVTGRRASANVVAADALAGSVRDLRAGCLRGGPRQYREDRQRRQDRSRGQEPARARGPSRLGQDTRAGGPGTCSPDYAGRAVDDVGARAVLNSFQQVVWESARDRRRGRRRCLWALPHTTLVVFVYCRRSSCAVRLAFTQAVISTRHVSVL